jgi:hypothetical protein
MSTIYVDNIQPHSQAEITMPARIAFRGRASSDSNTPRGSGVIVGNYNVDGTEKMSFDQSQGYFSPSSGIFTVPVTGLYMLSLKYTPGTTDGFRALIDLNVNGSKMDEIIDEEPADYYMSHDLNYTGLHKFEAGQQISISEQNTPSSGNSQFIFSIVSLG